MEKDDDEPAITSVGRMTPAERAAKILELMTPLISEATTAFILMVIEDGRIRVQTGGKIVDLMILLDNGSDMAAATILKMQADADSKAITLNVAGDPGAEPDQTLH